MREKIYARIKNICANKIYANKIYARKNTYENSNLFTTYFLVTGQTLMREFGHLFVLWGVSRIFAHSRITSLMKTLSLFELFIIVT